MTCVATGERIRLFAPTRDIESHHKLRIRQQVMFGNDPHGKAPARWEIGVDKRRVAAYVGLAMVLGYAFGYLSARHLSTDDASTRTGQREPVASAQPSATPAGMRPLMGQVVRVVRGDMLEVQGVGQVRLIGIETPEGKAQYSRHGVNALAFAEKVLANRDVRIEFDAANEPAGHRDEQGNTLAYVYTPDGTLFNIEAIRQGHAFVRTSGPFARLEEFRAVEREAMQAMRGVWGNGDAVTAGGDEPRRKLAPLLPSELGPNLPALTSGGESEPVVFVDESAYHRAGCEVLGKARRAMPVSEARSRGHAACSRCFASTVLKAPGR